MNAATATSQPRPIRRSPARRTGAVETLIRVFFGGNALVAVLVLVLITLFLFREGFGFFGANLANLRVYRAAGLEYVDIIREQVDAHAALSRALSAVRVREFQALRNAGRNSDEIQTSLAAFDQFADAFSEAGTPLAGLVSDLGDEAVALKEKMTIGGQDGSADLQTLRASYPVYEQTCATMATTINELLARAPRLSTPQARSAFDAVQLHTKQFLAAFPEQARRCREWDGRKRVEWHESITSFLLGKRWVTASFWQDWYGILPLLAGSLMVAAVALIIAVPFGIASAVYVSEIANKHEQRFIKPYIEFISAIPSVVLGFFGIAVVGQAVRSLSELPALSWVPFFPISERLNVFTAGALLALMAVPTIFTLAEDALRNVPRAFREASYALGATRLQTIGRVIVPAGLSGIISAVLLGLGRVIGETMVVLLCAGNRIAIPDFTQGLGAFFQPVHTMTGIIAQEMGEVVRGSIHYRALFMVGLVLFALTLLINLAAQKIAARYRMSIG